MQNAYRIIAVTLIAVVGLSVPEASWSATADHRDFDNVRPGSSQTLILERGRSVMLKFNGLKRVAVVDPAIADVRVMSQTELLVMGMVDPPVRDQDHTMIYVWDKDGLHNFAVTVVGMRMAERIAAELQQSLSPNLNVEVVSDTMVVVEGEVADEEAKDNLTALLEAAATDDVDVVGMIETTEETTSEAAQAAEALTQILDPRITVTGHGEDVVVIEGELDTREELQQARAAAEAVTEDLRLVDKLSLKGAMPGPQGPAAEIQELLGPDFVVTPLSGNSVAIDGTVENASGLQRVQR
ncbi:MAG: BON domain-containing protein, partial [Armatimonadia bacterium]|nr:BON domain-containing protein [Armatimonadia bacterium]